MGLTNNTYPDDQKKNIRAYLEWASTEFGTVGLARMMNTPASSISHALHTSVKRVGVKKKTDGIGPVFAQNLAAGLGLSLEELLTSAPPGTGKARKPGTKHKTKTKTRSASRSASKSASKMTPKKSKIAAHIQKGIATRIAQGVYLTDAQKERVVAFYNDAKAKSGLSGKEISRRMGGHAGHVNGVINKRSFSHGFVKKIAKFFGAKPEDITGAP